MSKLTSYMNLTRRASLWMGAVVLLLSGCGRSGDGLTKYPVKGSVTVNGQSADGVVVRFYGKQGDFPAGSNAKFPAGITDEEGNFQVSTNGAGDGAVPGEYNVTIVWPESDEPPLRDRLGGVYSTPEKSKLHATVESGENLLAPFAVEIKSGIAPSAPASRLDQAD